MEKDDRNDSIDISKDDNNSKSLPRNHPQQQQQVDEVVSNYNNNDETNVTTSHTGTMIPPIGPEPLLISRTQMDALYHLLQVVVNALDQCYYEIGRAHV